MKNIVFSFLFFAAFVNTACTFYTDYTNVDAKTFRAKMDIEQSVILDVRTPQEVAQGAIDGAINIDVTNPTFDQKISSLDTSKTYLVYCRSGRRSVTACNKMAAKGFKYLYNLEGGYLTWEEE